jgi:hypothetical protein
MRKQTNTPSPSLEGLKSPKFSDSDFREVRGLRLGRPKSSAPNGVFLENQAYLARSRFQAPNGIILTGLRLRPAAVPNL